jgi:NTE family protein
MNDTTTGRQADPTPTALVLSGGGAHGAYQVGVLRGLADLGLLAAPTPCFQILVGASAGAINAAALAARADDLPQAVGMLERVWGELRPEQVLRTDLRSLTGIGARWVRDLSFGGVFGHVTPKALLDTAPLRELLNERIAFSRIADNVDRGVLSALAILATDLYTSNGIVFLHGAHEMPLWQRGRWRIERTRIGPEHVMASSAIPIFFPSVEIDGRHFGDGCIRNTAPLRPAINLGAGRILAIGVRVPDHHDPPSPVRRPPPTVAQIAGVLLDAVMLDAIEVDVEHSERVNRSVVACPTGGPQTPFRFVDVCWISPSARIREIAAQMTDRIPRIVRYLMRGLGGDETTTELASFLLFDGVFCRRLMELGARDVADRRDELQAFFSRPPVRLAAERAG